MKNKNSALKKLGMKYNFIKNAELEEELEIIEKSNNNSLEEIELKNNLLSSDFLSELWTFYQNMNKNIKIDIFEILYYLEPERLKRTIWLNGDKFNENLYRNEEFSYNYMGVPLSGKKIRGRKIGHKKDTTDNNAFIEFICPESVKKAIKKDTYFSLYFSDNTKNIYKAGAETDYFFVKKKKYK